jgi:hypothetical protein
LEATVAAQPLYSLDYDLGLIDKQVRMLRALVDVSPVVHHASAEKSGRALRSEPEFVAGSRQSLNELVEKLELRVGVLRLGLERLKN